MTGEKERVKKVILSVGRPAPTETTAGKNNQKTGVENSPAKKDRPNRTA